MRLIDADRLLNLMGERYDVKKDIVNDTLAEGFMQMEKLIKEQPTIDEVIRKNLEQAYNQFNQAISNVAIDCAIYKICSCEKELDLYIASKRRKEVE